MQAWPLKHGESMEAIPCMIRDTSTNGEVKYALIIRPSTSGSAPNGAQLVQGQPPQIVSAPMSAPVPVSLSTTSSVHGPIFMSGLNNRTSRFVVQNGDQPPPKMLMKLADFPLPANIKLRVQSSSSMPSSSSIVTSDMWPNGITVKAATGTSAANNAHMVASQPTTIMYSDMINTSDCISSPLPSTSNSSVQPPGFPLQAVSSEGRRFSSGNAPTPVLNNQCSGNGNSNRAHGNWSNTNGSNGDSSTTPDSGIQSVPGTPETKVLSPPTVEVCMSVEDRSDEGGCDDFTDMPLLLPADQDAEHEVVQARTQPEDSVESSAHGSECEQPQPSMPLINITPGMDPQEIAAQLLLAMDPEKVRTVTALMRKKSKKDSKDRRAADSRCASATGERERKRARPESSASEELKRSEEESKSEKAPDLSMETHESEICSHADYAEPGPSNRHEICANSSPTDTVCSPPSYHNTEVLPPEPEVQTITVTPAIVEYRKAARKLLMARVDALWERMYGEFSALSIDERISRCRNKKRHDVFQGLDWKTVLKKLSETAERARKAADARNRADSRAGKLREKRTKKCDNDNSAVPPRSRSRNDLKNKKRIDSEIVNQTHSISQRSSRNSGRIEDDDQKPCSSRQMRSPMPGRKQATDEQLDYQPIATSESGMPGGNCPGWAQPPPSASCGCAKICGQDCLFRLLRVQCSPKSKCANGGCTNRMFAQFSPSSVYSVERSGRTIKHGLFVKNGKTRGEFVCEFAGEVIPTSEMQRRIDEIYKEERPKTLVLSSRLFVDATQKGNLARFVQHSCSPNSTIQTWLVNGRLRIGIFTIRDVPANGQITIDMRLRCPIGWLCDCGSCDEVFIPPVRHPFYSTAGDLTLKEESTVAKRRLFLMRNRTRTIRHAVKSSALVCLHALERHGRGTIAAERQVLRVISRCIRRSDGSLPRPLLPLYTSVVRGLRLRDAQLFLSSLSVLCKKTKLAHLFQYFADRYLTVKNDDDVEEVKTEKKTDSEKNKEKEARKGGDAEEKERRRGSSQPDLSYLDSTHPVGSYSSDDVWPTGKAQEGDDAVRCVCGSLGEDGEMLSVSSMLQCDGCQFWLHNDCVGLGSEEVDEYKCDFCEGRIPNGRPSTDVLLHKLPEIRLPGCTYYKALVNNSGLHIRMHETVYVQKLKDDRHKRALKKLEEFTEEAEAETSTKKSAGKKERAKKNAEKRVKSKETAKKERNQAPRETTVCKQSSRRDVRVFRVILLFESPYGDRYLFGFYYARPHETYRNPQKSFHPREVFSTDMYDTLPLDSVMGRCAVLDSDVWVKGVPTLPYYKEEDILLCEYHLGGKRVPEKSRFPINTQPYAFRMYDCPIKITRTFKPFAPPSARITKSVDADECRQLASARLDRIIARVQKSKNQPK